MMSSRPPKLTGGNYPSASTGREVHSSVDTLDLLRNQCKNTRNTWNFAPFRNLHWNYRNAAKCCLQVKAVTIDEPRRRIDLRQIFFLVCWKSMNFNFFDPCYAIVVFTKRSVSAALNSFPRNAPFRRCTATSRLAITRQIEENITGKRSLTEWSVIKGNRRNRRRISANSN